MKQRSQARSSSLFLIELIFAIFFFLIASAICVQFFVKAHTMSRDAVNLNTAANETSAVAEVVLSCDSMDALRQTVTQCYLDAHITDDLITVSDEVEATYSLDGNMLYATISYAAPGLDTPIYSLDICHYLKGGDGHE